jgi:hypothetical protein
VALADRPRRSIFTVQQYPFDENGNARQIRIGSYFISSLPLAFPASSNGPSSSDNEVDFSPYSCWLGAFLRSGISTHASSSHSIILKARPGT